MPDPWPLRHLVLRTPRLTLCPDDDEGLYELAGLALCGVHLPHECRSYFPGPTRRPTVWCRGTMQYYWGARSRLTASDWNVNFLVRYADPVIGAQGLSAKAFPILGVVSSGSWLPHTSARDSAPKCVPPYCYWRLTTSGPPPHALGVHRQHRVTTDQRKVGLPHRRKQHLRQTGGGGY